MENWHCSLTVLRFAGPVGPGGVDHDAVAEMRHVGDALVVDDDAVLDALHVVDGGGVGVTRLLDARRGQGQGLA